MKNKMRDYLHLKEYGQFSVSTLDLYQKEYDLGRRSLLDLLTAQNDFINSKKQIIHSEMDIIFSQFRVLDGLGVLVLAITHDDKDLYARVGLNGYEGEKDDELNILLDSDKDIIADDLDASPSTISKDRLDQYGNNPNDENIATSKVYGIFSYTSTSSDELNKASKDKLKDMIGDLEFFDANLTYIDISTHSSHVDNKKPAITQKRAETFKKIFIDNGINKDFITISDHGVESPLYSSDKDLNSRIEITIKEMKPPIIATEEANTTQENNESNASADAGAWGAGVATDWSAGISDLMSGDTKEDALQDETVDAVTQSDEINIELPENKKVDLGYAMMQPEPTYEEFIKTKYRVEDINLVESIAKDEYSEEFIKDIERKHGKKFVEQNVSTLLTPDENASVITEIENNITAVIEKEADVVSTQIKESSKNIIDHNISENINFVKAIYIVTLSSQKSAEAILNSLKYDHLELQESSKGKFSIIRRITENEDATKILKDVKSRFKDAWMVDTAVQNIEPLNTEKIVIEDKNISKEKVVDVKAKAEDKNISKEKVVDIKVKAEDKNISKEKVVDVKAKAEDKNISKEKVVDVKAKAEDKNISKEKVVDVKDKAKEKAQQDKNLTKQRSRVEVDNDQNISSLFVQAIYVVTVSSRKAAEDVLKTLKYNYLELQESNGKFSVIKRVSVDENASKILQDIKKRFKDAWIVSETPPEKDQNISYKKEPISDVDEIETENIVVEDKISYKDENHSEEVVVQSQNSKQVKIVPEIKKEPKEIKPIIEPKQVVEQNVKFVKAIYIATVSSKKSADELINSLKYQNLELKEERAGKFTIIKRLKDGENAAEILKEIKVKYKDAWMVDTTPITSNQVKVDKAQNDTALKDLNDNSDIYVKAAYLMTVATKEKAQELVNACKKNLEYKHLDILENNSGAFSVVRRIKNSENAKDIIDEIRKNFKDAWLVQSEKKIED
jgi:hypothetical protein